MNRRLLVDLEALAGNYELFRQVSDAPDSRVGAVVKANAYGVGADAAVSRLEAAGCSDFFVASAEEGLSLKGPGGVRSRVFVFEGATPETAPLMADAGLIPVLNHPVQMECWRPYRDLPIGVHVDTGMSRLGFTTEVNAEHFRGFDVQLLLTHLACADDPANPGNRRQIERFDRIRAGFPGTTTSIGNSAGWLTGALFQGDLGRPGIGLYGGNPFSDRENPTRPVASLQGRVLQLKTLPAGDSIGYGGTWVADKSTNIAVVGIGYADGVPRLLSNRGALAFEGQRLPMLGRVSMDMTVIDVGSVPHITVGDWVECFGSTISIDEVAGWAQTIAYEVLTGVGPRVERLYQRLTG